MSLIAKIEADLKQSMIAKTAERTSVLRMLKSSVKYASIEKGGADTIPTDAEVMAVVRREVKKRQDSITSFVDARRDDLADKEKSELIILQTYLPAALGEAEMERLVQAAIDETGATSKAQMGTVMKAAQARAEGRADGKTLSQIVQRLLK